MTALVSALPAQSVLVGVGVLVAAGLAWVLGRRQGVADPTTAALFSGCVVGAAAFSRLAWFVLEPAVAASTVWGEPGAIFDLRQGGYNSLGALAGAALVVGGWAAATGRDAGLGRRQKSVADVLVVAGLAGLALARLGCLSDGCDFGRPTDLSWAVQYPAQTRAFMAHLQRGWVEPGAHMSAAVHPFGGYLAGATLLVVAAGAWALWSRRVGAGKVAVWTSMGYFGARFWLEWFRDPATAMSVVDGLNILQVLVAVAMVVVAIVGWVINFRLRVRQ